MRCSTQSPSQSSLYVADFHPAAGRQWRNGSIPGSQDSLCQMITTRGFGVIKLELVIDTGRFGLEEALSKGHSTMPGGHNM